MRKFPLEEKIYSSTSKSSDSDMESESDSWWSKKKCHCQRRAIGSQKSLSWPTFNLERDQWDEWKAKTVRKQQRLGYNDEDKL
jgi:hypothetical protein